MHRQPRTAHPLRLSLAALVSLGLGAAALVAAGPPASAAVSVSISAPNGTVGVTETVTATVASTTSGTPAGTVTFTSDGKEVGVRAVGGALSSSAQLSWTPIAAGSATVQAAYKADDGQSAIDSTVVQLAKVDTAATMVAPGTATPSSKVVLTATVLSRKGQYVPTGTMTFLLADNSVIGRSNLDSGGHASLTYTVPSATGNVSVLASYGGDASANASKTPVDTIKVTSQTSTVTLVVPQTNYVNTPVALLARVTPATATGSVDFSVNGKYLGTGKIDKGSATLTWVPGALGTFTLTATYAGGGGVSPGTATNSVQVVAQLKTDQITVVQVGSPGAWVPATTTTLTNGSTVTLAATAASGQAVQLSVVGPCSLVGNVLNVNGVGGACALTASTKGGNGYAPVTVKYTVQTAIGAQTARILAPRSGSYARGLWLRLSAVGAVTNVKQPVRWRVTKGTSICRIVISHGFYKVRLLRHGTCVVVGSAPGITNQWAPLRVVRTYRVR